MNRIFYVVLALCCLSGAAFAQEAYHIEVELENFDQDTMFLGYYYGDKQYIQDTTARTADGTFVFSGDEALKGGIYLLVLPPENDFLQIMVTDQEQRFSLKADRQSMAETVQFTDAPDNALFYEYMNFLAAQRPEATQLQEKLQAATDEATKTKITAQLEGINDKVAAYQKALVTNNPNSLSAAVVAANMNMDMPEFSGSDEEQQMARWRYTRDHYFDNVDLTDARLVRTPFLFNRVETYVEKLHYQIPDSIIIAIDKVLGMMEPAEDTYKFYLIHFLNKYAASKMVGMDAVYVHLAMNYYDTGKAPWTEEEQRKKIVDNAKDLEPLLIGKTAPNIEMQKRDGSKIALHDVNTPYTVLYFWRYDCGHCKKSTPFMQEFYEQYKDKGVTLFAVCAKTTDEVAPCWEYVDENEIGDWLHTVDPYLRSRYSKLYNLKTTPQIYILDQNKEIIMKRIGAEQLPEVMEKIMEKQ